MILSDLTTGQEALITGIYGDSNISRRLNEMGFIEGQKVKAIKSAPLKDPVEYSVMGYQLTIRRKDAAMIEVEPLPGIHLPGTPERYTGRKAQFSLSGQKLNGGAIAAGKRINIALVGNPNSGKTTIFNYATRSRERVANYSGVTVSAREAEMKVGDYTIIVTDLPGTYSLTPYSPEEQYVTDYIMFHQPHIILNVVDAGNLERNLFLTTQLIETGIPVVVALNMWDEFVSSKGSLDIPVLATLLGVPVATTTGKTGEGVKELFEMVVSLFTGNTAGIRSIEIPYPADVREALTRLSDKVERAGSESCLPGRFIALKLLQGDPMVAPALNRESYNQLVTMAEEERNRIEKRAGMGINPEIVNSRYGFINGALAETLRLNNGGIVQIIANPDRWLTHRLLGLPLFFLIIWFIFWATFKLGQYPMQWIESGITLLSTGVQSLLGESSFSHLLVDGIIGGVGGIAVFLPNIMILFFLISLLEDTGYMARTAFLMDKVMHRAGLHGKSFIPLLMGFGCNVPAIMATRTIESRRDRLVTMLIIPFMSCSARLPVYVLFISAFFPRYQGLLLFSIYGFGILAALLTAFILNKTIFRRSESPFVMELPPYRIPTFRSVRSHTWFKTLHFIKKMGTVILVASVVVWVLSYFPRNRALTGEYDAAIEHYMQTEEGVASHSEMSSMPLLTVSLDTLPLTAQEKISLLEEKKQSEMLGQSWIATIGKTINPLFEPLGFDWKMSVSILTGIMAKELVVSTMAVLYQAGSSSDQEGVALVSALRKEGETSGIPRYTWFGFLLFTLLYFPCFGTLAAITNETSRFRWVIFAAAYPLIFSWITVYLFNLAGRLIAG
jgi:ferrous iron transport protein B